MRCFVRVLLALGGNAMTAADGSATPGAQQAAIAGAMEAVAGLIAAGHEVVITHGNGPQVGNLLVKNELAAAVVPPVPLDWCGAQTQATIGFTIINALESSLSRRGCPPQVAAIVTRTRVADNDPGFAHPTKPIGRFLPYDRAATLMEHGQLWQDRGEKGWRRIVASPAPLEVLETAAILTLIAAGYVVVAAGGGGIPVVRDVDGVVRGVEAVIDKDLTAALLARSVGADVLVIATDVDHAIIGYETESAQPVGTVTLEEMRELAAARHFASGSMGPKVSAAMQFVRQGVCVR
jgi:carbamate kinase